MISVLADLSRLLNRWTGGEAGRTLCWRAAMRLGDNCLFCRFIGFVLRQEHHCSDELTAQDIVTRLKRK